MDSVKIITPAKINLTLDVLKKDTSGYHEIQSIIMPIALFDEVIITKKDSPGIQLKMTGIPSPKGKENIVHKAASLFFEQTKVLKTDEGIEILLHKNIPITAGLGGGSSDAAATLIGLDQMFDTDLSPEKLEEMAIQLGMEVVYFLEPQLALISHFGEKITPIKRKNPKLPDATLFLPMAKKTSTKNQYERLDIAKCGLKISDTEKLLDLLRDSPEDWNPLWSNLLHNDFNQLYKTPKNASHLSGSGPVRFIISSKD
ncbi:MAG: 4-(cytidine 5'-diphospho)-2-C-methyl-D-erythritol kinase [Candidatus Gracilibacteria bacterium]